MSRSTEKATTPLVDGGCDCKWEELAPEQPCGCGEEDVRLYRDHAVHFQGKHWRLSCAFKAARTIIDALVLALEACPHSAVCRNEDSRWAGECLRCMALARYRKRG